jgi:hypothetical protein
VTGTCGETGRNAQPARPVPNFLLGYSVQPFVSLVLDRSEGSALSKGIPGVDAALIGGSGQQLLRKGSVVRTFEVNLEPVGNVPFSSHSHAWQIMKGPWS